MKRSIFTTAVLLILLSAVSLGATDLSPEAQGLKADFPEEFEAMKANAAAEWPGDFGMQVYELNNQIEAFIDVMSAYDPIYSDIYTSALFKWTDGGAATIDRHEETQAYKDSDISFAFLPTDWVMVKYEINKQLSAYISLE